MKDYDERQRQRMAEDLAIIRNPSRWPGNVLNVKRQSWTRAGDGIEFGLITAAEPTVLVDCESGAGIVR